MTPYPLKFKPIFKERIWGGRTLERVFHKPLPAGIKIGESWEVADLPQDKSLIANGPWAGQSLHAVVQAHTQALTGLREFPARFPLLIKFLDARDMLSVQVHPDAETCRRTGQGDPKTECWYIIAAEPGACIYNGLKPGVTRESFAEALTAGTVDTCLTKVPVKPGECHFLPAGTVHAMGAGLLIAEIQLPSDTTYRVFDWNRVDDQGRSRPLHIEQALESIHFDASHDDLSVRSIGRLVDCPFFKVDKGHQVPGSQILLSGGLMRIHLILTGGGTYRSPDTPDTDFTAGECVLIPAAYQGVMTMTEDCEFLTVTL